MTTTTHTISRENGARLVRTINSLAAVDTGHQVEVDGREVWSRWAPSEPATLWQNGTVSVQVRGREPGKQGEVYVKVGQVLSLTTPGFDDDHPRPLLVVLADYMATRTDDPRTWARCHTLQGHDASVTQIAAPGYGTGSWCWTCKAYGPSTGGILTEADVR